ncbi:MAG: hypothetical protein YFSK_2030 [Candidatus Yanofskyibacterium parasiticum]|nr:MAG: hypothetical protein YFSK_2030 [Candidatus Yanofskybacteria bacterium]
MKKNFAILILVLILAAAVIAILAFGRRVPGSGSVETPTPACETKYESFTIRGDSLAPLFSDGQEVKLFSHYYDCHPLSAGDAVAYRWAGDKDAPLAKIVKAVAGDRWRMELMPEQNAYQIEVNGQWLANSEGALYQIPEEKAKMLLLYAKSYPQIPEGTCLILGNLTEGSVDSVRFGLAPQENIAGKIEPF